MTTTALERKQIQTEQTKILVDAGKHTLDKSVDVLKILLNNPVVVIIAANVLIEYLQTVRQKVPAYDYASDFIGPKVYNYKPLLSQAHATTLEGIINTQQALSGLVQSVGGLGGIMDILKLFIK